MSRETVVTCDVCERVVSDVLRDRKHPGGRGYTERKRTTWWFDVWAQFWRRVPDGIQIVCDYCWDDVRELAHARHGRPVSDTPMAAR